jgi:solute carrier family 39 (zinc transporter), member 1/2/3
VIRDANINRTVTESVVMKRSTIIGDDEQAQAYCQDTASQGEKDVFNDIDVIHSGEKPVKKCCNATPYVLMMALSIHSIFEGIALGLQPDMTTTLEMVIAIGVHKGAAATALGISLVKNFPNDFFMARLLVFIFAMATPIGILIGILAQSAGETADVIMSSLAGGTFIYIGCTEMIVAEFSVSGHRGWKLLSYLCGAALITSLCFMAGA